MHPLPGYKSGPDCSLLPGQAVTEAGSIIMSIGNTIRNV